MGRTLFGIIGFEDSKVVQTTPNRLDIPILLTELLVTQWAHQFRNEDDSAQFQVISKFLGKAWGQGSHFKSLHGYFVVVAEENHVQMQDLRELDLQTIAALPTVLAKDLQ